MLSNKYLIKYDLIVLLTLLHTDTDLEDERFQLFSTIFKIERNNE